LEIQVRIVAWSIAKQSEAFGAMRTLEPWLTGRGKRNPGDA
jgi:hypothetical protein